MEAKRQSLAERQSELDRVRREAAEIARNVTDLNELIARLDKAVAAQTGTTAPARCRREPWSPSDARRRAGAHRAIPPAVAPSQRR